MTMNDPLANALSHILNSEKVAKTEVLLKPKSKMLLKMLDLLKEEGYVGEYEEGVKTVSIKLLGQINKCGVIKPRYSLKSDEYEKYEKRFLPARDFGVLIVSTTKGLLTHQKAKEEGLGGKLIAYIY